MALEDAQRTVGLVRLHAAEWHIDPNKIGVLGFSAGGHLVAAMSTHFAKRLYPAVDTADKETWLGTLGIFRGRSRLNYGGSEDVTKPLPPPPSDHPPVPFPAHRWRQPRRCVLPGQSQARIRC